MLVSQMPEREHPYSENKAFPSCVKCSLEFYHWGKRKKKMKEVVDLMKSSDKLAEVLLLFLFVCLIDWLIFFCRLVLMHRNKPAATRTPGTQDCHQNFLHLVVENSISRNCMFYTKVDMTDFPRQLNFSQHSIVLVLQFTQCLSGSSKCGALQ